MRYKTINKDKAPYEAVVVRNAETVSIKQGTPVIYKMNNDSGDGLDVIKPSSSTAVKATALFAGCLIRDVQPGQIEDAICAGFCRTSLISRGTRAATTDAWPSFVAIALGDALTINTSIDMLNYTAVGAASAVPAGIVFADAGKTAASTTTAASDAYTQWSGGTAATILAKCLIRNM